MTDKTLQACPNTITISKERYYLIISPPVDLPARNLFTTPPGPAFTKTPASTTDARAFNASVATGQPNRAPRALHPSVHTRGNPPSSRNPRTPIRPRRRRPRGTKNLIADACSQLTGKATTTPHSAFRHRRRPSSRPSSPPAPARSPSTLHASVGDSKWFRKQERSDDLGPRLAAACKESASLGRRR